MIIHIFSTHSLCPDLLSDFLPIFFPLLSFSLKTISVPFSFLFVHVMVNHVAFHGCQRDGPITSEICNVVLEFTRALDINHRQVSRAKIRAARIFILPFHRFAPSSSNARLSSYFFKKKKKSFSFELKKFFLRLKISRNFPAQIRKIGHFLTNKTRIELYVSRFIITFTHEIGINRLLYKFQIRVLH